MEEVIVEDNFNTRIDVYLADKLNISRSKIQKLIKQEKILVNDKRVTNNYLIMKDDIIQINDELDFEIHVKPQDIPLNIVYENDDLLVINKESGMVVHP